MARQSDKGWRECIRQVELVRLKLGCGVKGPALKIADDCATALARDMQPTRATRVALIRMAQQEIDDPRDRWLVSLMIYRLQVRMANRGRMRQGYGPAAQYPNKDGK
jgi:hypothetical protein